MQENHNHVRNPKTTINELMGWSGAKQSSFAGILAENRPIQDPEEASMVAQGAGSLVKFLGSWALAMANSQICVEPEDAEGLDEVLLAVRVMLKRIEQWEDFQVARMLAAAGKVGAA
jgi:hypothetical protein